MSVIHGVNYGTPTLDLNFAKNKSLIDTASGRNLVTFTRAQTAREATYVGADGLIKSAVADEPRFDHNPATGESLGLLVEEQRTNYHRYSTNFANWTAEAAGSTLTPTSDTLDPAGGTGAYVCYGVMQRNSEIGPGAGASYPFRGSIFVKKHPLGSNDVALFLTAGGGDAAVAFNFDTETLTNYSGQNITFQKFANGWYRIGLNIIPGSTNWRTVIYGSVASNNYAYVYGMQIESATFDTSYIPTSGSTVTRSADVASITGTNFSSWYNSSENTVFCQGISASRENSGYYALQGSVSNGSSVLVYPANTITWQVFNSSFQVNSPISSYNSVSNVKSAVAMKSNDFAGVVNGGSIFTDNLGTVPAVTSLVIGNYLGGGPSYDYTGTINRLTYYPTRLQDFQLQQLTK